MNIKLQKSKLESNPLHKKTPAIFSRSLSKLVNTDVYLKLDCLQPTGSFKIRGIGKLCQHLKFKGIKHFISSSAGNAGHAVAYAGRLLQIKTTVIIPETASPLAKERITGENAKVIIFGKNWDEANQFAQNLVAKDSESSLVHPFDHSYIWEGNATLIDEVINNDKLTPTAIILSVGGGGLFCGVCQGLSKHSLQHIPIITAETEGAASFKKSFDSKKLVELENISTIATPLGVKKICDHAFYLSMKHTVIPLSVTDLEALNACVQFANDHRILVEPACGASLAILYNKKIDFSIFKSVLVIICGGSGISFDQLNRLTTQFGLITHNNAMKI